MFKGTECCYIFDISRNWHEKYNLQKCLKNQIQKNSKNMKRSRSTYQPRESCPALRNRCPRKLKNSSNTSEPSRSTSSRYGRFLGARTCSVNVTYTVISHQSRVSKLAESGARHDLSIFLIRLAEISQTAK